MPNEGMTNTAVQVRHSVIRHLPEPLISPLTISRPALITWHEGRLVANLHRLWNSIGRRVLP